MKRAATLVIVALCGLAGASVAASAYAARPQTPPRPPGSDAAIGYGHRVGVTRRPLAAPGGAGVVDGTVYTFDGAAVAGTQVYAGWKDGGTLTTLGPATTDPAGFYSLSGVPATSLGIVQAQLPSGDYFLRKGLAFADPGTSTFDLRPGAVDFSTTRATSGWGTWRSLVVFTSGSQGETRTVSASTALSGRAWAMAPEVSYAVVYYWSNEAAEVRFVPAVAVSQGVTTGVSAGFKEGSAFRMWIAKPSWASGRPGTALELHYSGWPGGTPARFSGAPTYPPGAASTSFGGKQLVSAGTRATATKVTVPATARPGYWFVVHMYRPEDPVWIDLSVAFQVSTLSASRTLVSPGGAVRLSGVVPVAGHVGTQPGAPVTVTVYRRTTAASGPPPVWDATARGWSRLGAYASTGLGAFHTGYLHPLRTTWYVARYTARPPYLRAYTSVLKVTVY